MLQISLVAVAGVGILLFVCLATRCASKVAETLYSKWVTGYTMGGAVGYVLTYYIFAAAWLLESDLLGLLSVIVVGISAVFDFKSSLVIYRSMRRELKK
jgi:hypothetical protein